MSKPTENKTVQARILKLHFSVPNHGKLWKSLLRVHLGEYELLVNRLKTHH